MNRRKENWFKLAYLKDGKAHILKDYEKDGKQIALCKIRICGILEIDNSVERRCKRCEKRAKELGWIQ
ncbi:MAG: hypothetical protein K5790_10260 [Nitrosopumilus sp.]|uniref:hypothetical protein n=1 Tax=Nitrosopumilus sp. TaxID=2024843 RepID=UPI00247E9771|nr:hypothetical protein [Nitrosopumilus sp.]MCV0393652.1 hypothetical protein [Nitrosopumilus sp.]